jgi:hypothetical protein
VEDVGAYHDERLIILRLSAAPSASFRVLRVQRAIMNIGEGREHVALDFAFVDTAQDLEVTVIGPPFAPGVGSDLEGKFQSRS